MTRLTLLALLLATPFAIAKGPDIEKVNGSIRTEAAQQYGDLETVNGSVEVAAGVVAESVESVNGEIDIGDRASVSLVETVNGSVELGREVTVQKSVETVNGSIDSGVGTKIGGGVGTVNGAIAVEQTEIAGTVSTVNGDITIGRASKVLGGILIEKPHGWWSGKQRTPRVVIGPDAVVEGELRFEREVELFVHDSAKIGSIVGATAVKFSSERP